MIIVNIKPLLGAKDGDEKLCQPWSVNWIHGPGSDQMINMSIKPQIGF